MERGIGMSQDIEGSKVKWEIKYHCEEDQESKILTHAFDMYSTLNEIQNKIRNRIKYCDIPEAEEKFLEEIRELTFKYDF